MALLILVRVSGPEYFRCGLNVMFAYELKYLTCLLQAG